MSMIGRLLSEGIYVFSFVFALLLLLLVGWRAI